MRNIKTLLRRLAEARAAGVSAFLVQQGKLDPTRIFQKSGESYSAPAKSEKQGNRVEFEIAVE